MNDPSILQRLRTARLRPTVARIAILQLIEVVAPARICAEDVFRQMLLRGTRVSIGTVYRCIHQFEDGGLLLREWDRDRKAHYRIRPAGMDAQLLHLVCPDSGRIISLGDEEAGLHAALVSAARRHGVNLSARSLTVGVQRPASGRRGAQREVVSLLSAREAQRMSGTLG